MHNTANQTVVQAAARKADMARWTVLLPRPKRSLCVSTGSRWSLTETAICTTQKTIV